MFVFSKEIERRRIEGKRKLRKIAERVRSFLFWEEERKRVRKKKKRRKRRKKVKKEDKNFRMVFWWVDNKGQFTIHAFFALFITLTIVMYFMPQIYDICNQIATTAEQNGDSITAFVARLIPMAMIMVILASIFYYAKPYIIREE